MRITALVFFLLFSSASWAIECNPEGTQQQMNQCAYETFEKADKVLNDTWKALMQKSKHDKNYKAKMLTAQRAWLKFRDAQLDAMFACEENNMRMCWGSMYPLLYHLANAELVEQRTEQLKQYLNNGQNDGADGW